MRNQNITKRLTVKNRQKHLNHPFSKRKTNDPPKGTQNPKIFMWGMQIYHTTCLAGIQKADGVKR